VPGEEIGPACRPAALGFFDKRDDEGIQFPGLTVIGMQCNVDGISVGDALNVLRDRDRAEDHVLHGKARGKGAAAGRDLDDAVAAAVRQPLQHGVGGGQRPDVDGRIRNPAAPRPVEHVAERGAIGYWHGRIWRCRLLSSRRATSAIDRGCSW
jgi:hypothetical protein